MRAPPGVPDDIAAEVAAGGAAATVTGLPAKPVAFVGLMASGKTSLGRRTAAALDVPFVDADHEIERREGRTVAEIFAEHGESGFRAIEERVLRDLLAGGGTRVIATGGGAVLSAGTRTLLREGAIVVWLRAAPAILASRVKPDGTRPLLAEDPRGTMERLSAERAPLYSQVAHHVIDVDGGDRRVLLRQVLAAVCPGSPAEKEEP